MPLGVGANQIWMGLSVVAAAIGLTGLFMIIVVLFWQGFSGLSLAVFTQMTPPPGSSGGLLNAIAGSLIMTVIGVAVGTPLGLLAGTYLAEYGRHSRLAMVVRFINDILLSAPSIVIGLFVYEIVVVPMGHFSAIAGSIALAVLVVPIVRAHDREHAEPGPQHFAGGRSGARHAAFLCDLADCLSRGERWSAHRRPARVARVSGETAPLLFTALNNQFWSTDLAAANVEPADRDLPVRLESLQGMAAARLDRGIDHHARGFGAQHLRASARCEGSEPMNTAVNSRQPATNSKVIVRGLDFYYGATRALKDVSLSLYDGEVTAFIGPSGCGKSTLLRVLNRMYDLYPGQRAEGEVLLDGENILAPGLDLNLLRSRVGMVFQKPTPFPMTIYDNIAFGVRLYEKLPKSEMDERVESALRGPRSGPR